MVIDMQLVACYVQLQMWPNPTQDGAYIIICEVIDMHLENINNLLLNTYNGSILFQKVQ